MFSDLECDYINPIDLCNKLNMVCHPHVIKLISVLTCLTVYTTGNGLPRFYHDSVPPFRPVVCTGTERAAGCIQREQVHARYYRWLQRTYLLYVFLFLESARKITCTTRLRSSGRCRNIRKRASSSSGSICSPSSITCIGKSRPCTVVQTTSYSDATRVCRMILALISGG